MDPKERGVASKDTHIERKQGKEHKGSLRRMKGMRV